MAFIFSTPVLIRHLWLLKAAVFLHRCLLTAFILHNLDFMVKAGHYKGSALRVGHSQDRNLGRIALHRLKLNRLKFSRVIRRITLGRAISKPLAG